MPVELTNMVDPTSTDLSLHPPDHTTISMFLFSFPSSLFPFFFFLPRIRIRILGGDLRERRRRSEAAAERGGSGSRRLRSEVAGAPTRDAWAAARLGGGGIGSERRRASLRTERWGGGGPDRRLEGSRRSWPRRGRGASSARRGGRRGSGARGRRRRRPGGSGSGTRGKRGA